VEEGVGRGGAGGGRRGGGGRVGGSAARKLEHNILVYSPTWEWNAGILDNQKANMALLLSNKK